MADPRTGKAFGTGFRHTACTMLNELEYPADAIELQTAHLIQNIVRGTYNKAQLMPERTKIMTEWADYIDDLLNNWYLKATLPGASLSVYTVMFQNCIDSNIVLKRYYITWHKDCRVDSVIKFSGRYYHSLSVPIYGNPGYSYLATGVILFQNYVDRVFYDFRCDRSVYPLPLYRLC
jgi:hypothetical protein